MKKRRLIPLLGLALSALIVSCSSDDPISITTPTNSYRLEVLNEATPDSTSDQLSDHRFDRQVVLSLSGSGAVITGDLSGLSIENTIGHINIGSGAPGVEYILRGSYSGVISISSSQIIRVTLDGASIDNEDELALNITSPKAFIYSNPRTSNSIVGTPDRVSEAALYSSGKLVFAGSGSLSVTSRAKDAIYSLAGITAGETALTITSARDGLKTRDYPLILNSGSYSIQSVARGIRTTSSSTAYATANSPQNIIINGGTYDITATGSDGEGIKAYASLQLNGGTIHVNAYDDAFSANVDIAITGGNHYASSTRSDAFDSNGTIHVSGGTAIGLAVNPGNVAFDCDRNDFVVTGGTLIGLGSNNLSYPTAGSTQPTVILGATSSAYRYGATLLSVQSATGTEVLSYQIPQNYTSLFLSSPALSAGSTYTLYTGGSHTGTATNGLYTGGSYTAGTSRGTFTTASASPFVTRL